MVFQKWALFVAPAAVMMGPMQHSTPSHLPSIVPARLRALLGALALATAFTGGCGEADGDAADGRDLDGTWTTACYQKTTTSLTYADLDLVGTYTEYADDACTSAIHVSTWTGTGTVAGQTAAGAHKLDLSFASFESTALTAENADFNNTNMYCGLTNWTAGVKQDVLGRDCYGFSIPEGGESLDIYMVDGDTLKFGKGAIVGTDLSEADRPSSIDDTRVFTRQAS